MMRKSAFLGLAALLTACSGGTQSAAENVVDNSVAATLDTETIVQDGWTSIFADAAAAVRAFEGTGFRPGSYEPQGKLYRATGARTTLSNTEAPKPNLMYIVLEGDKQTLHAVRFEAELGDEAYSVGAKKNIAQSLDLAFAKIGLPGADAVRSAVLDEKQAKGGVLGAYWSVTRSAMPGKDARRLTVTFTPAAINAAESQPRKQ